MYPFFISTNDTHTKLLVRHSLISFIFSIWLLTLLSFQACPVIFDTVLKDFTRRYDSVKHLGHKSLFNMTSAAIYGSFRRAHVFDVWMDDRDVQTISEI